MAFLLDTSALMALIQGERGSDIVRDALYASSMCAANLVEFTSKLAASFTCQKIESLIIKTDITILPLTQTLAYNSGILHSKIRKQNISYMDAICLQCAIDEDLEIITADKAWVKLEVPVKITVIR